MENKYKKGDEVYERVRPSQKLVISKYAEGIYYCNDKEPHTKKALVFLERDLKPAMEL